MNMNQGPQPSQPQQRAPLRVVENEIPGGGNLNLNEVNMLDKKQANKAQYLDEWNQQIKAKEDNKKRER